MAAVNGTKPIHFPKWRWSFFPPSFLANSPSDHAIDERNEGQNSNNNKKGIFSFCILFLAYYIGGS